jgi:hypothetical protein
VILARPFFAAYYRPQNLPGPNAADRNQPDKDAGAGESIAVVLSQDAVCLGPDGQPWSGVSLKSEEARKLAARLLSLPRRLKDNIRRRQ